MEFKKNRVLQLQGNVNGYSLVRTRPVGTSLIVATRTLTRPGCAAEESVLFGEVSSFDDWTAFVLKNKNQETCIQDRGLRIYQVIQSASPVQILRFARYHNHVYCLIGTQDTFHVYRVEPWEFRFMWHRNGGTELHPSNDRIVPPRTGP